jgi:hypothetical protein
MYGGGVQRKFGGGVREGGGGVVAFFVKIIHNYLQRDG